jgi:hypothetical protein
MRNLTLTENLLVSGGDFSQLTGAQSISACIAFCAGATLGFAGASIVANSLAYEGLAGFAVKAAGTYLGMELGGAIWEANHNFAYYKKL